MTFDFEVTEFERAVRAGDHDQIVMYAPAALAFMRAATNDSTPGETAARIELASGGINGLFQIQAALKAYMQRPGLPVELRLNGVYQNCERDTCIAIFDNAELAVAYFKSALLPEELRFTDPGGYFRSFRSDSLCYNCNPHGGDTIAEGRGIICVMEPWRSYEGSSSYLFGEPPPPMNPDPLTGPAPPPPAGSKLRSDVATT